MKQDIRVELTSAKKPKPDPHDLAFGRIFTDHMFVMDYDADQGWYDPRIIPYQSISMILRPWFIITAKPFLKGLKRM